MVCSAAAASEAGGVTLVRLCGTSAGSSTARDLLASLGRQLAHLGGGDPGLVPSDFKSLLAAFPGLLADAAVAASPAPLRLFVDSLDQLSDEDQARSEPWRWLAAVCPPDLPDNATVTVSTLPDDPARGIAILSALRSGRDGLGGSEGVRDSGVDCLQVEAVSPGDAADVLGLWLGKAGRTLAEAQWEEAKAAAAGELGGAPVTVLQVG